jgi:tRNA (cytosine40_48-C5)-methyltransferase
MLDMTAPEKAMKAARIPAGPKAREWARRNGFSDWIVARLVRLTDDPARVLDALKVAPPRYLRANPLRSDVDEVRKRLVARGFELARTDLDPNVLRINHAPISPGATHEHLLGMTMMQDLSSASAPIALGAQPGETVVDLAAAPGVKTLHMAADMANRGAILAVEPDADRMRALRFNLERTGVANALLRLSRGEDVPGTGWADRVLLDAPCTGEGTIPKDRKRRRGRIEEIDKLCLVQSSLMDAADRVLRPGGVLVYATCTFGPEENEAQVQRLVDRGYELEPLPFDRCGGVPLDPGVTAWPGLRLDESMHLARRFLPGIHPTLGFFVARLRKPEAGP